MSNQFEGQPLTEKLHWEVMDFLKQLDDLEGRKITDEVRRLAKARPVAHVVLGIGYQELSAPTGRDAWYDRPSG